MAARVRRWVRRHRGWAVVTSSAPATTSLATLSLHDALPIWTRSPAFEPSRAANCASSSGEKNFAIVEFSLPSSSHLNQARPLARSEEHTSELQSRENLVCRLLLEKKHKTYTKRASAPKEPRE